MIPIGTEKDSEGNKYIPAEQTESDRTVRGAWKADMEYLPEFHTQRIGK
jgi:hypothetical protein